MNLERCPICAQPVLGLFGQDTKLDTYALSNDEESLRIVESGVFGEMHVKCLVDSPWGPLWARRLRAREVAQGRSARQCSAAGWSVHATVDRFPGVTHTGYTLISDAGQRVLLAGEVVAQLQPAPHRAVIVREMNVQLDGSDEFVLSVQQALLRKRRVPLLELIRKLGIEQRLLSISDAHDSFLSHDPELQGYWRADWIAAQAHCSWQLPEVLSCLS